MISLLGVPMTLPHVDTVFFLIDILGVFVGAVGGGISAIRDTRYKYDVIGVVGLAFVSALGGGIARDIILQKGPPLAFIDARYAITALVGGFATLLGFSWMGRKTEYAILLIDAAALGLFAAAGTIRATDAGLTWLPSLLLGVVTAVGGGSLRDVLTGRTPKVFEGGQFYAIAALLGAACFLVAHKVGFSRPSATLIGTIGATLLRVLSVHFNWRTQPVRNLSQS